MTFNLIASFIKNCALKTLKVDTYYESGKVYTLYTVHDNKGNYMLSNDKAVFLTEKRILDKFIKEEGEEVIHGKPQTRSKELFVHKINNKLGIYDGNLKMKHGPFRDFEDVEEFLEENEIEVEW